MSVPQKLQLQVVQGLAAAEDMDAEADDTGVAGKLTTTFGDVELNCRSGSRHDRRYQRCGVPPKTSR